jgi:hypothetical protein
MNQGNRILLFFLLPAVAPLFWPPAVVLPGLPFLALVALLFFVLGFFLWRGNSLALTLSIFLQGLNVIIRLMMFFPNSVTSDGVVHLPFIITSLISMGLSFYLMLRLDQTDVRIQMVT